ncbi:uncharacterized protein BJ212DRAFT_1298872 [Suillus subaureus]|uniref:Uncharacterized protein n=1 Tax=Suillus subaureus TaxID=48587 RepID=A0A9P7ED56_9AGAM|nr:uncharacterized protein BJ212DRAFT_1298872 [Suillus subaureus]KAG1818009.1 hypothetical protein BJ212DRAFT_1298872 [Suillus subaureus]
MTWEVSWFHAGIKTTRPKTGDLLRVFARSAGVDTMILLEMFGDLLVLDTNVHRATIPVTWVHYNLVVMVAQGFLINQDGIHPILLQEYIMDHGQAEIITGDYKEMAENVTANQFVFILDQRGVARQEARVLTEIARFPPSSWVCANPLQWWWKGQVERTMITSSQYANVTIQERINTSNPVTKTISDWRVF